MCIYQISPVVTEATNNFEARLQGSRQREALVALVETHVALLHVLVALYDSLVVLADLFALSLRAVSDNIFRFRVALESRRTLGQGEAAGDALCLH